MPTIERHYGAYIIRGRGHGRKGTLVQTDWDFPATAEAFGWSLRRVQRNRDGSVREMKRTPPRGKGCDHAGTDGTITCRECGLTATDFITAAANFLDSRC